MASASRSFNSLWRCEANAVGLAWLLRASSFHRSLVRQAIQQVDAENHDQQADCDDDEQREREPTQHHRTGAHAALHAPVSEVLCDLRSGY